EFEQILVLIPRRGPAHARKIFAIRIEIDAFLAVVFVGVEAKAASHVRLETGKIPIALRAIVDTCGLRARNLLTCEIAADSELDAPFGIDDQACKRRCLQRNADDAGALRRVA